MSPTRHWITSGGKNFWNLTLGNRQWTEFIQLDNEQPPVDRIYITRHFVTHGGRNFYNSTLGKRWQTKFLQLDTG